MSWTILVTSAVILASGCSKKSSTAVAPPPDAQGQAASNSGQTPAQTSQQAQPAQSATQVNTQPDLGELDRSLMRWLMANRRRPKDFEDFAATAGVKIPPPPPGKKYVIRKDMHIILVDR